MPKSPFVVLKNHVSIVFRTQVIYNIN